MGDGRPRRGGGRRKCGGGRDGSWRRRRSRGDLRVRLRRGRGLPPPGRTARHFSHTRGLVARTRAGRRRRSVRLSCSRLTGLRAAGASRFVLIHAGERTETRKRTESENPGRHRNRPGHEQDREHRGADPDELLAQRVVRAEDGQLELTVARWRQLDIRPLRRGMRRFPGAQRTCLPYFVSRAEPPGLRPRCVTIAPCVLLLPSASIYPPSRDSCHLIPRKRSRPEPGHACRERQRCR